MATTDVQHTPGSSRSRRPRQAAFAPRRLSAAPDGDGRAVAVRTGRTRRALDIVLASVLLVVTSPILAAVAVVVLCSGRPVLFRHTRVGAGGELFPMYKFRTMVPEAEALLAADPDLHRRHRANGFKLPADQDHRITRVGRFLRSTSLDELPQLLNVLRGDMAMVGPRPIVPDELSEYASRGAADIYLRNHPGLTGLWQVSGRGTLNYDERIALDRRYDEERGLVTDLGILLRTVPSVLSRHGAH